MTRVPAALALALCLAPALADAQQITITRAQSQAPRAGPAQYFTGSVRIDPLFESKDAPHTSAASVNFEGPTRRGTRTRSARYSS
jgi:hypothetical protein